MPSITMLLIFISMAFNAHAEWIDTNETLQHRSIKPTLCSEFSVANETDVAIDSETCIAEANFHVFKKYLTTHEGKVVVTLLKLKIRVRNVECDGKIKKTFGRYYVNHRGQVIYRKPRFEVTYVDNCDLVNHIIIQNSQIIHDHVVIINQNQYLNAPYQTRRNIESIDLSMSLDLELDLISTKKFIITNFETYEGERLGYLLSYLVRDTDSEEEFEIIARFNLLGRLIGLLEY
ncbi:MAG: hypothetical protein HN576_14610 [Bacteriovoracaceae bacterium]|nr:hypothetical protein [Bacteriovoracaceae bacterium]